MQMPIHPRAVSSRVGKYFCRWKSNVTSVNIPRNCITDSPNSVSVSSCFAKNKWKSFENELTFFLFVVSTSSFREISILLATVGHSMNVYDLWVFLRRRRARFVQVNMETTRMNSYNFVIFSFPLVRERVQGDVFNRFKVVRRCKHTHTSCLK